MPLHPRRQLLLGSAAWLLACGAAAATRKRGAVKPVALVEDDAADAVGYGTRDDVVRFADAVAERRGLDAEWLRSSLAQARFQPLVTRYIMPTASGAAKKHGGSGTGRIDRPSDAKRGRDARPQGRHAQPGWPDR